jgi:hypothetical protein
MFSWNAYGSAGLAAGAVAMALAAAVLLAAPARPENRRLALVLFLEGTTDLLGGGLVAMATHVPTGFALQATAFVAFAALTIAYLLFLAALPSPLTRPLRRPWITALLFGAMASYAGFVVVRIDLFLSSMNRAPVGLEPVPGPWMVPALLLPSLPVLLFGLAAALAMWRSAAPGTAARRQGAFYAVAFTVRDAGWIVFIVSVFFLRGGWMFVWLFNASLLLSYVILAYGMLRTQLLGIDLTFKWTLRRGALLAALAAVFFLVQELLEAALPFEGLLPGVAGAAAIAILFRPVWRLAGRVADRVLPGVDNTEDYRALRRREIYLAAYEAASEGSGVTARERSMLQALAQRLGLDARAVQRLEAQARPAATA